MSADAFAAAVAEGGRLDWTEAVSLGLCILQAPDDGSDSAGAKQRNAGVFGRGANVVRLMAVDHGTREIGAVALQAKLTPRELEVLGHLATGESNREIAAALVLSVRTVERHLDNIYAKTGLHGRQQLRAYARSRELVLPA
ncbi:MAG TPA: helix-turn-helix transcriptional regulator [Dehalococcoidia bacterium]|jgi:DNA-binding NarL/FixJ family response regulator